MLGNSILILVGVILVIGSAQFAKINSYAGHTSRVYMVKIFPDMVRYATASNDTKFQIRYLLNQTSICSKTYSGAVTNFQYKQDAVNQSLDKIYVSTIMGQMSVINAIDCSLSATSFGYPTNASSNGYGNFINIVSNKMIVGGYDGSVSPKIYIYTLSPITLSTTITTTFQADNQITVMSTNSNGTTLVAIDTNLNANGTHKTLIYNLANNTLQRQINIDGSLITYVTFSPFINQFYTIGVDKTLRVFEPSPATSKYDLVKTYYLNNYTGSPSCIDYNENNSTYAYLSVGSTIIEAIITTSSLTINNNYTDVNSIYVIDVLGNYIVTGMSNGSVSVWQYSSPTTNTTNSNTTNSNTTNTNTTNTNITNSNGQPLALIIGAIAGIILIMFIIGTLVYCLAIKGKKQVDIIKQPDNGYNGYNGGVIVQENVIVINNQLQEDQSVVKLFRQ